MPEATFDQIREKYLKLIQSKSSDEVITALHREIGKLEPKVFDGGFDSAKLEKLEKLRELARELMTYRLNEASKKVYG